MQTPSATPRAAAAAAPAVYPDLDPLKPERFGFLEARHLLLRAGFGGTPEQVAMLRSWGPARSVDYLLNYESVAFDADAPDLFDRDIIRPANDEERGELARARRTGDEESVARLRAMRQEAQRLDRQQMTDVQHWWLKRMIETPRPLEEKMTLFWHSLLTTSYRTIEDSYHMYMQNRLYRAHALGNFGDLLRALIRDPAMLAYLDNNDSRKGRANENLARELMELFSLGVGEYSEKDIKEGARALTGYTFEDDAFVFRKSNHDGGNKSILGASGTLDGDDFVGAILRHPACPRYVARRVYRAFAADLPTGRKDLDDAGTRVVASLAQTLRSGNYNLRPMLRRLLLSEHFYSPAIMSEQIKSPVELVVGAVRTLNTPVRDLGVLADACNLMGQNLFFPPSVKGWEGGRSWINTATLFIRQNILCFLLTGKTPQGYDALAKVEKFDAAPLLEQLAAARGKPFEGRTDALAELLRFTIGAAGERRTSFLAEQLSGDPSAPLSPEDATRALLLITAMPEYQLC